MTRRPAIVPGAPGAPGALARHPVARAVAHRRAHRRALLATAAALVAAAACLLAASAAGAQAPAGAAVRAAARSANAARREVAVRRDARDTSVVTIERESFAYAAGGRRDPFKSLLTTSDLRPLLAELRVVAVAVDPEGRNSVAILRDLTTKAQHRVRVGQLLGRMRVAQIRPRAVVFTIEELGFSRQEILALSDSTVARSK